MDDERHDCGHTDAEHEEMHDLMHLVSHVQAIKNPRVALIVTDSGEVHFATTLPPREAAEALRKMADRAERYGSNYVQDHYDRADASRWN